ncbi:MAG: DUF192 domain-containing protein [Alphaproteobacteria bacterium]|nr:DUF192 domain-containing protein [Alphaproteobacteria bacterium]
MKRQDRAFAGFFLSLFLCVFAAMRAVADVGSLTVETADGTEHHFGVELALTPEARAQGLMFRRELGPNKGMLFVFPDADRRSFWMKNTYIPLDIIFIRRNGTIANIVESAEPETLTSRSSTGRASAVLEIPGGRAAELGIKAGDLVRHSLLGTAKE